MSLSSRSCLWSEEDAVDVLLLCVLRCAWALAHLARPAPAAYLAWAGQRTASLDVIPAAMTPSLLTSCVFHMPLGSWNNGASRLHTV